jgi:hypothetical protein
MTSSFWLRVSSVISLLFAAGHSMGGRKDWSPMGDNAVLRAMKAVHFDTMGAHRSYYDFFIGFGISLSVSMVVQAAVLWFLADLARTDPAKTRPMAVVFAVASAASVAISWRYLFPMPALFALVLTATLVLGAVTARREV